MLLLRKRVRDCYLTTAVYNPKAFFLHAVSLDQAFAHCRRLSTAASRRSRAHVAVPLLEVALSRLLPVIALVSHYLTNKLIGRRPLPKRAVKPFARYRMAPGICRITPPFGELSSILG